ncbi:MAG: prepilin-type N-terminal cleavage/methylation domain-containing protein [Labilithrix sp.]|nr:prepilin-type N-terminal cleavage/methylation domain-containing protein [Labilithrix sp.]MCW5813564.1 prepilin-type N-terminal cleavage/methylation domain-containing protein [Labilithrix sp.]
MTRRARRRGMTLLEIMVSMAVMAMISLLIYGAFDSISRGRRGEALRADRARQGRDAIERIVRELQGAYISMHTPSMPALVTRTTGFYAQSSSQYDRVDFTAFAHRRVNAEARESDQAEIGYFVVRDPDVDGKMDLVRREEAPIDIDFKRGGVVNVLAEDVETFDLKYLDPLTGQWVETWDSTLMSAQLNRLPLEVRIELELKPVKNTPAFKYVTKAFIPIQQPLTFGIPK